MVDSLHFDVQLNIHFEKTAYLIKRKKKLYKNLKILKSLPFLKKCIFCSFFFKFSNGEFRYI